jgi:outer membrane protein
MKKLLFAVVMSIGFLGASAQKIGYINSDELIAQMPEAAKAQTQLAEYQQALAQQGQDMMTDLKIKDSTFSKDSAKFSPSIREIKRKELYDLYQKAQNFQQQEAQDAYQQKMNELVAPIRDKASATIKTVAKENNYAYVLEEGTLLVMPPADNLMPLVKAKLGIKDTPVKPATTPVRKP